jgi:hypothetical protein
MPHLAKSAPRTQNHNALGKLCLLALVCLLCIARAHAGATLLLEEPYSYDGTFAGTGHVAVYLNNVCSASPVLLRPCRNDESGIVLSRYDGISGYDWIAVPLVAYLYAVDRPESAPLFADAKLVAFLRDQYRRDHLESVAPDLADGAAPAGNWYELVGASYDRTIYGFEIETTPEQDALLIEKFNSHPNVERYNFVKRNCADFVREVINFYYPHALHRSVIGDLGVTTPKQIAKMLAKYSHHHPELDSSNFILPQVPGAERRSTPIHGVLESVMSAKKYMVPLVILHPYIGGGLLVEHFGHRRFDPARNALILDSDNQLVPPITRDQRVIYQSRLNELSQSNPDALAETKRNEIKTWAREQASAHPAFDADGRPILQIGSVSSNSDSNSASESNSDDEDLTQLGISRANILNTDSTGSPELASRLLEARIRQELRPATIKKTAPTDVGKDLALYQQLLSRQAAEEKTSSAHARSPQLPPSVH